MKTYLIYEKKKSHPFQKARTAILSCKINLAKEPVLPLCWKNNASSFILIG